MRSFVVGLALLGSLAACDSSTASNSNLLELSQREMQWEHRDFHSYIYDYKNASPLGYANAHVTVTADTISNVIDIDTGMPPQYAANIPTINALFLYARSALGRKHTEVTLRFDSQYGYPTQVSAFEVPANPGGGYDATVTNLQPTQ